MKLKGLYRVDYPVNQQAKYRTPGTVFAVYDSFETPFNERENYVDEYGYSYPLYIEHPTKRPFYVKVDDIVILTKTIKNRLRVEVVTPVGTGWIMKHYLHEI